MIILTNYFKHNTKLWINKSMIQSLEINTDVLPTQTYTTITMHSGLTYCVIETPEQILSMTTIKMN
jgi:uncharacterized protein YlzI (FlbEa/FlbD family)